MTDNCVLTSFAPALMRKKKALTGSTGACVNVVICMGTELCNISANKLPSKVVI